MHASTRYVLIMPALCGPFRNLIYADVMGTAGVRPIYITKTGRATSSTSEGARIQGGRSRWSFCGACLWWSCIFYLVSELVACRWMLKLKKRLKSGPVESLFADWYVIAFRSTWANCFHKCKHNSSPLYLMHGRRQVLMYFLLIWKTAARQMMLVRLMLYNVCAWHL